MFKPSADAHSTLYQAIRGDLETDPRGVPCLAGRGAGGTQVPPGAWTAEHPGGNLSEGHPLALAAEACEPCPVRELCRAAGEQEVSGVWGGRIKAKPERAGDTALQPTTTNTERLAPAFLVALATRSSPATARELIEDVAALTGDRVSTVMVGRALAVLVSAGDAVRHKYRDTSYEATSAGVLSAEQALTAGQGAFASSDPAAP